MQYHYRYFRFAVVALLLYVPNVWGKYDAGAAHINRMYAAISKGTARTKVMRDYFASSASKNFENILACMKGTGDAILDWDVILGGSDSHDGAPFYVKIKHLADNEYSVVYSVFSDEANSIPVKVQLQTERGNLKIRNIVFKDGSNLAEHLSNAISIEICRPYSNHR